MCLEKIVGTKQGDVCEGFGTGFLYEADQQLWLVTNWHVLTGRRPDNPGHLLRDNTNSPYKLRMAFPTVDDGTFATDFELRLYGENNEPIWREFEREDGVDLAAIPIEPPVVANLSTCTIQDFCDPNEGPMEPGLDVIIIGFPFQQGDNMPYPVWKRGLIATEPAFRTFGAPQFLVDSSGRPGMSGSPVYRLTYRAMAGRGEAAALMARFAALQNVDEEERAGALRELTDEVPHLRFIGVYAGSTGDPLLERLALGRVYPAAFVDHLIKLGEPGKNPFPPFE